MEYLPQVKVSKEDFLALSELAGDMSIMDYMSKVIHEHVTAQHHAHLTPETQATSQAESNASALEQSDGDTPPAQAQVA